MKRIACTASAFAAVVGLFWVGGLDFDMRGSWQAIALMFAIWLSGVVYFCPIWEE